MGPQYAEFEEHRPPRAADEDEVVTHLAHDLRNLLQAVHGHADLQLHALGGEGCGPDLAESLQAIRRAADHAVTLCEDLLQSAQGRPAPFAEVDLGEVAHSAAALFLARAGSAAELELVGPEDRVRFRGRRLDLERALLNLMWNALEAMEEHDLSPRLRLSWGPGFLEVRDHGPGLDPAALTAAPTTRDDGRVHGIGLASVRRVAAEHGGRLVVRPAVEGRGTVCRIEFGVQPELGFGG